jgi:uncharacterized protein (TIGR04141 family)
MAIRDQLPLGVAMAKSTRPVTLYRLVGITSDETGLLDALDVERLDELNFTPRFPDIPEATTFAVEGHFELPTAEWCLDASLLTGLHINLDERKSASLLLIAVDGQVYAIGFGQGFRLIPDKHKDPDFGLRFAIRAVDPAKVRDVWRRSMTGQGRQDATFVPSGIPIDRVGLHRYADIVRKLGGAIATEDLGLPPRGAVTIEGSAGLRLPIPLDPARLVTFLRRVTEICERKVQDGFAFIDAVRPVHDRELLEQLDSLLDQGLRGQVEMPLAAAVPTDLVVNMHRARSYRIKVGSVWMPPRQDLDLNDLLHRCRVQHCVTPSAALRNGQVEMCAGSDGSEPLGRAKAIKWLEASVPIDDHLYFLIEGDWYESGIEYVHDIRRRVAALISNTPSFAMPPWRSGDERAYNRDVQDALGQAAYLCLDRTGVRTELHTDKGFEPCDGLGPNLELIHVKQATKSSPLSHLFNQALISTEALMQQPEARRGFAALVEEASGGHRTIPPGTLPKKVIFAILLKKGTRLTPDTLFPFAQVALVNMADTLQSVYGVDVEVIGIPGQ